MTYEKDNQAKVLILILKDHRTKSVAVPGAACLSISCATAEHYRDSKALSPVKGPVSLWRYKEGLSGCSAVEPAVPLTAESCNTDFPQD